MANRVYHWKHGWIPLDHTAAVQKYGSAKLAEKHGFASVSHESLPRKSHIHATFDTKTKRFTVRDLQSGESVSITEARAEGIQARKQTITRVSVGSLKFEAKKPATVKKAAPAPAEKKIPGLSAQARKDMKDLTDTQLSAMIRLYQRDERNGSATPQDKARLEGYRAEFADRTKPKKASGAKTKAPRKPPWASKYGQTDGSHNQSFSGANPGYDRTKLETYINCAKASQAYELRRRGIAVEATHGSAHKSTEKLAAQWSLPSDPTGSPRIYYSQSQAEVEAQMKDDPPGARYMVAVTWKGTPQGTRGAHIWNAEKMPDGSIRYFDAQIRKPDASGYLGRAEVSGLYRIRHFRVDNAYPKPQMEAHLKKGS